MLTYAFIGVYSALVAYNSHICISSLRSLKDAGTERAIIILFMLVQLLLFREVKSPPEGHPADKTLSKNSTQAVCIV